MDEQAVRELIGGLQRLMAAKRAVWRRLGAAGLTLPAGTAHLLDRLAEHGPARVGDLAQASRCHLSVASRLVAELEEHGVVIRRTDPADGRSHLVVLTPAGLEYLRRYREEVGDLIGAALSGWSTTDVADLAVRLDRLNDGLDRALGAPVGATAR